ncbi:DEAD/DEAH box helicase family protein [Pseudoalteromonas luteoviolacea]|uniref:DEAD/DEAH box helicase family protein n=1 Tax=Pseudoalteromonas luteoviolacea TaxID=43657 RepID=UPI00228601FA|nr:DEAD/DEAH box helicase family protein [Pseudoalteromonas luteoviolacea]
MDRQIKRLHQLRQPFSLRMTSNHLDTPKAFTSITYQALHAKIQDIDELEDETEEEASCPNKQELAAFISHLESSNIKVLILDEAHHLRQEWWKALTTVCEAIPDMVIVSLTATPPYDAQGHEWIKYEQLCGPIDEENFGS